MTGPQHLHAHANLWSLSAIWPPLAQAAQNAQNAQGVDRGTVQAWRPGSGVHSGRTSDQILDAIVRCETTGSNPYASRLAHAAETIDWVARNTTGYPAPGPVDTIHGLIDALPQLQPSTALNIALWIGAEDRAIRKLLRERPDHQEIDGLLCPYCGTAGFLAIRASAPPALRPVICTAGCTCDGPRCHCGMGELVEGLPHIWTYDQLDEAINTRRAA